MWSKSPLLSQGGDFPEGIPLGRGGFALAIPGITVFFESNLSSKPKATTPCPSLHRRGVFLPRFTIELRFIGSKLMYHLALP